jgi:hypothetical protein
MYIYRIIQYFKYSAGLFARTEVCALEPFEVPRFYATLETTLSNRPSRGV